MFSSFFFNDPATTEIYTLSLHDALPIYHGVGIALVLGDFRRQGVDVSEVGACFLEHGVAQHFYRSEEHTSELQSQFHLVCRLLLEKKNKSQQFIDPAIFISHVAMKMLDT